MPADFYKELGVARDATPEELKRAYRKLAAELHPDRNPGKPEIEARFKAVNNAYQALSDRKRRALYDEFGEEGLREGFNAQAARAYRHAGGGRSHVGGDSGIHFEDIFASAGRGGIGDMMGDLFSGARHHGGRRRGAHPGADLESEIEVELLDAIRGTTVSLAERRGATPVAIRIPPGAGDGDRVRVPGHGGPGSMGGPPGDLVITVRVRPHPHFERDGLDLHLELPITVGEAYRGAKVAVPTPQGDVSLKIPPHAKSGQTVRLKERGVKRKDEVGDLYVRFLVQLPDAESREVEAAIETLEHATPPGVRADIKL